MMASLMKHRLGATVPDQPLPPSSAPFSVAALPPSPFGIKVGGEEAAAAAAAVAMGLLCGYCCPRPAMPRADCGRGRRLPATAGGGGGMAATDLAAVAGPAVVIAGGIAWLALGAGINAAPMADAMAIFAMLRYCHVPDAMT